jgi:hypothetical protein
LRQLRLAQANPAPAVQDRPGRSPAARLVHLAEADRPQLADLRGHFPGNRDQIELPDVELHCVEELPESCILVLILEHEIQQRPEQPVEAGIPRPANRRRDDRAQFHSLNHVRAGWIGRGEVVPFTDKQKVSRHPLLPFFVSCRALIFCVIGKITDFSVARLTAQS